MANTFVDRYILQADDRTKAATASAQRNLERLNKTAGALKTTLVGVGAAFVIQRAAKFTADALGMAESIGDVAEKAGITAEQLQVLRFAAEQNGSSADKLDKAMIKLAVNIGQAGREALGLESTASPAGQAMEGLGVSVLDASGNIRSSGEVFPELIDKIAAIASPAERAAVAAKVFGTRIGPELAVLINAGSRSLEGFEAQLRRMGGFFTEEQIEQARQLAAQFDKIGFAVKTNFTRGFLTGFMGEFTELKDLVQDPKFVQSINDLGRGFGNAMQAVVESGPIVLQHIRGIRDAVVIIAAARFGDTLGKAFGQVGRNVGGVAGLAAGAAAVAALRANDAEGDAKREEDAQREAADVAQKRLTDETATSSRLIKLKDDETTRLTAALQSQKDAYRSATQAIADALREREQVEQEIADFDARGKAAKPPSLLTAVNASNRARSSLENGDPKEALRQAREALQIIEQLREAGGNDATSTILADKVKATLRAAAQDQQSNAQQLQAQAQQAETVFQGLLDKAKALENLKVGLDDAAAIVEANSLRAALEKALAANPIVIPVVLDRSAADTAAATTVDAATVPGRAHGGYLPGSSPHPRADNLLFRGTAGELLIGRPEVEAIRRRHGEGAIATLLRGRGTLAPSRPPSA